MSTYLITELRKRGFNFTSIESKAKLERPVIEKSLNGLLQIGRIDFDENGETVIYLGTANNGNSVRAHIFHSFTEPKITQNIKLILFLKESPKKRDFQEH